MDGARKMDRVALNMRQLQVFRAMLRLGVFTRKELASATEEGIAYINDVVSRHRDLLRKVERRRLGRAGPSEEVWALRPDAQAKLLEELEKLYPILKEYVKKAEGDMSSQVPAALEFQVARELIQWLEGVKRPEFVHVSRAVSLLTTASETQGIPAVGNLEADIRQAEASLTESQRLARAYIDAERGKLCWLSAMASVDEERWTTLIGSRPLSLGLRYFKSAAMSLREYGAKAVLQEMDSWGVKFLARTIAEPQVLRKQGSDAIDVLLLESDSSLLPGIHAQFLAGASFMRGGETGIVTDVRFCDNQRPLTGIRVLDCTSEAIVGHACGLRLSQLGAELVRIDPPGRDLVTPITPFSEPNIFVDATRPLHGEGHTFSITLNLMAVEGRNVLTQLVRNADIIIENDAPGAWEASRIGYSYLRELNPRLIYCWIKRGERGVKEALSFREQLLQANSAALVIVTALYRRGFSGVGEFLEVGIAEVNSLAGTPEQGAGRIVFLDEADEFPLYQPSVYPLYEPPPQNIPRRVKWLGRRLGEDNRKIYREWLGLAPTSIDELKWKGVI